MKLATTTCDFKPYAATLESIKYIRQAGFRYVDYNFHTDYLQKDGVYTAEWRNYLKDVKREADRLNVRLVQAHSPMCDPIGKGSAEAIEITSRSIESCGILEIPNLVVHAGTLEGISKEENFSRNKAFYEKLLPLAEKYKVNLLTENFPQRNMANIYRMMSAMDLRELVDFVDHPLFHACWDTGHGNTMETPQDEALNILGDHVYALHVQDNMGYADPHMAPLCGTLNLDSLMHGLLEIGYKGYFTFEACYFFGPSSNRKPYDKDQRMLIPPLELQIMAETLLYEIGKYTLATYDCLEE